MADSISNSSNNIAVLKELYSDDAWVMKSYILNRNPALALVEKDESPEGLGGKYFPIPALVQGGGGRSANYGNAGTYSSAPVTVEFQVTRVANYSNFQLTGDFLRASAESIGAFMPAAELNTKAAFQQLGNDYALMLFGDGSGKRGSYGLGSGSISGSGVITLDNAAQAMNFTVGMALVSYSVSGLTPTQSTSAAIGYVIAVDTGAGTVSLSASFGGVAGLPTNWSVSFPYVAQAGDVNFISSGLSAANMLKMAGFAAWIPSSAPSSTSFFGVDRSVAPSSLAGLRFNGSGESIQDALIDSVNTLAANGTEAGDPDFVFLHPVSYQTLVKQLTSQGVYQMVKAKINEEVSISFKALVLPTANGEIAILQDRNCAPQTAYVITLKTWKLRFMGKMAQFITWPGFYDQIGIPVAGSDAVSVTVGGYGNLTCNAPAANAVVSLSQ